MNDRLDISEIFLKGPLNPNQEKKKKPTKGPKSNSYAPLAPIPVYMIHPVIVHVYTNFQLSSFDSS